MGNAYLKMVKNTARMSYLKQKIDNNKGTENIYDLITEYIGLVRWFEELSYQHAPLILTPPKGYFLN